MLGSQLKSRKHRAAGWTQYSRWKKTNQDLYISCRSFLELILMWLDSISWLFAFPNFMKELQVTKPLYHLVRFPALVSTEIFYSFFLRISALTEKVKGRIICSQNKKNEENIYRMLSFPFNLKWMDVYWPVWVTQMQYRERMMKKEQLFHLMWSQFFQGIPWIHLHIEVLAT